MHTIDEHTFPSRRTDGTGDTNWLIMKFGGTSVSSPECWATIRNLVAERQAAGFRPVIVHSALATVSNRLEAALQAAVSGEQQQQLDEIISVHTDLSTRLGSTARQFWKTFLANWRSCFPVFT